MNIIDDNKHTKEKFLRELAKLNTEEFLGVAVMLHVDLFEEKKNDSTPNSLLGNAIAKANQSSEATAAPPANPNVDSNVDARQPKDFSIVIGEMIEAYEKLNRSQRRNLFNLVKTATKKKKR